MKKPTGRSKIDVFDIDEEEESVEKESFRLVKRYAKLQKADDPSPITKYTFLERFVGKETTPQRKRTAVVPVPMPSESDNSVSRELKRGQKDCMDVDTSDCSVCYGGNHVTRENTPVSRPSGCIDKDEDENDRNGLASASPSPSTESKSSCEQSTESDVRSWIHDTMNKLVVVSPDSIMHEKIYCTDSILTFMPNTIKLVGSFVDKNKETFSFEWPVSSVLKIESQWCQDVETAIIKIYFRVQVVDTSMERGLSGMTSLKFTIYDSSWFQGEEAIKLLDAKYKALWNVIYDIDSMEGDDEVSGTNRKENCVNGETFEVLVFPKGEHDAVSITLRDMELLQPETFINDTIIDFYMKYLMTQVPHKERNRFYFFNSFFFRKLADLDKDSNNKSEQQEAFQRVRKWTRNTNLFEKDFIFIPVNFSLHWSLIIICHPGELLNTKDYAIDESSKCSSILHLDSLRGSHRGLKNLFQRYLKEELKLRQDVTTEDIVHKVLNIRFISAEVPQQQNSFDCGLFLLHYVERFLQHASNSVNMHTWLNRDWFPPAEVSCKRSSIRELIQKLLLEDSDNQMKSDHSNLHSSTLSPNPNDNQTKSCTLVEEGCSSPYVSGANCLGFNEHTFNSRAKQVISAATSELSTPETLCHAVSKFCSEVAEKFSDCSASSPNHDSVRLSVKGQEPSTSYSSKIINSLKTSLNTGLSRLQGMSNTRNKLLIRSPDSSLAEDHNDAFHKPTGELNNSKSRYTLAEDLEQCIVQDSEDDAVDAVNHQNSSRSIVPFHSRCVSASLADCVVQDSESEDELEPKPIIYKEKDVINIEDSSKSYKIIDLSSEADDSNENAKPPKRPRLKLDRPAMQP